MSRDFDRLVRKIEKRSTDQGGDGVAAIVPGAGAGTNIRRAQLRMQSETKLLKISLF
ncbi:hypothetical protein [Ensifer aridi]|uniref:hypothetical protein n=1 Tax=Ensifer aridi TaxID=1708715 RepID=UPI0014318EED|nr:hypothetical protein [Ensifer aridi]